MRILVTGANGFVGRALCKDLIKDGHEVLRGMRINDGFPGTCEITDLTPQEKMLKLFLGVDCIIHLAARVHAVDKATEEARIAYNLTNTEWPTRLALAASEAGVRRLIFLSSIGVCGNDTNRTVFTEADAPSPQNLYSHSKWKAEQSLREISNNSNLELVILRPTLVYGEDAKANFLRLLSAVRGGMPMPFATLYNRRSFLYLGNLVAALSICVTHPKAAGQTFIVSDGAPISLVDLYSELSRLMGHKPRMFPCSRWILMLIGNVIGRRQKIQSLVNNLEVDSSKIERMLDWHPPYTIQQGLKRTVAWYMRSVEHA